MEHLIEIYTFYIICTPEQKQKYLNTHIKQYIKYPNLFKFFEKVEIKDGMISFPEYLSNFNKTLRKKMFEDKKKPAEILNEYKIENQSEYYAMASFLIDIIINEPESDDEQDVTINTEDDIDDKETFLFQPNQIRGIEKSIETNFATGIHSQATGTGKSIMALKIMREYHMQNPTHNLMWFGERIDIPKSLFFRKGEEKTKFFKFLKDNDIFNFDDFNIIDFINTPKPVFLNNAFLDNYMNQNGKPYFIVINRAFATSKSKCRGNDPTKFYKYQEILDIRTPKFIVFDECHSGMAEKTYEFLNYAIYKWRAKIHGLSATPYRKGTSKSNIREELEIIPEDNIDLQTRDNKQKLLNIFHKESNIHELNVISWCNIKEAIEQNYILEPVFHWFNISSESSEEVSSILSVLDETLKLCQYKKCIVWCKTIELTRQSHQMFIENCSNYEILKNLKPFIDHSKITDENDKKYDEFYGMQTNAILFCACKYREGSDIPYLNCELFLDKVKDRTEIVYIQSIGRVLRKDKEKLKEKGHIIDSVSTDSKADNSKVKNIINKILGYYAGLYDISFKNNDAYQCQTNKIDQFNAIMSNIKIEPRTNTIYIILNNNKKITVDLKKIDISTIEWSEIIKQFKTILETEFEFTDLDKFIELKKSVSTLGIMSDKEYKLKFPESNPDILYQAYWKGWYDFLNIDTSSLIKDIKDWRKKIVELNINSEEDYYEKCKLYTFLPIMPQDIYKDIPVLYKEFKKTTNRRR